MQFVQTSSEADDNCSNHTQVLDIKPYNISKEYGIALLNNLYKTKGINHSQSFFLHHNKPEQQQEQVHQRQRINDKVFTPTNSYESLLSPNQQEEEEVTKPTPQLQHSQSCYYLDPTLCDKRPPLHRQNTTGHMDTCLLHRSGGSSRQRRQTYRGGAATAERRAISSIAYNQYKHTGSFEQPPRHPPSRKSMYNSLAAFRRTVSSADFLHETYRQQKQEETPHNNSASSSFYSDANSGEEDSQQQPMDEEMGIGGDEGEGEGLPPLLIETLMSAPQLRINNPANTERLREKMAVETLMLEWGWTREVARAVYVRQGQLQEMRNSGVSLAEYAELLAQRRLSGHKHGMSSKSFSSGNHASSPSNKKTKTTRPTTGMHVTGMHITGINTSSNTPAESSSQQTFTTSVSSKPHPCALQMPPPSIHFVF